MSALILQSGLLSEPCWNGKFTHTFWPSGFGSSPRWGCFYGVNLVCKYLYGGCWSKQQFAFGFADITMKLACFPCIWCELQGKDTEADGVCVDRLGAVCTCVCWWPDNKTRVLSLASGCAMWSQCQYKQIHTFRNDNILEWVCVCHCGALTHTSITFLIETGP